MPSVTLRRGPHLQVVRRQQTDDMATAGQWLRTLTAGGIEGLVVKDAAGTYPTQAGQRVW